jgi:hypothetical protein
MLFSWANHANPDSWAARMRRQRMDWFAGLLAPFPEPVTILDVGGTPEYWQMHAASLPKRCSITVLNLTLGSTTGLSNVTSMAGDARKMDAVADQAFAVCFSNSVIEHVGTYYDQMAMASEICRVAQSYFVQTPNRYFPLEPHFLFPFWQFLPRPWRAWLHRHFRLGWVDKQPASVLARADVEQIRLLSFPEMKALFPAAGIRREKIGPLTKSLAAMYPSPSN